MEQFIYNFLAESWKLTAFMAPYLVLGFFFGGVLYAFLPSGLISRHLGKENFAGVVKASLFGIPLPLCSCGVLPVATSARESGAGRAPTLSFLITTPVTGIDSILATYALLGWIFTVARIIVSLILGLLAGVLTILIPGKSLAPEPEHCPSCELNLEALTFRQKIKKMLFYAFYELPETLSGSVLLGLVIAGLITVLIPAHLISDYIGTGLLGILVAVFIAVPLYVCATGSIPVATAMILKGFSPGAALAFLIAGPATNAVAITTVRKILGTRALLIYLAVIFAGALGFGKIFDFILPAGYDFGFISAQAEVKSLSLIYSISGAVLLALLIFPKLKNLIQSLTLTKKRIMEEAKTKLTLKVKDMTCSHCRANIITELLNQEEIKNVKVDLKNKLVVVTSDQEVDPCKILSLITKLGYHPELIEKV